MILAAVLVPASLLVPLVRPQQIEVKLRTNDLVAGRPVRIFERAVIDDEGSWSEVVILDPVGRFLHGALVRDGNLLFAEGTFLPQAGARVYYLGVLEGAGDNAAQNVLLDLFNPPRAYGSTEAILHRGTILLTDKEPVMVTGLPSSAVCTAIGHTAANGKGTVLTVATADGVPAPGQVLLGFEFDAAGTPLSRDLLMRSGGFLPDGTVARAFMDPVVDELGNWMVGVETVGRQERLVTRNRVVLAAGDPSPIPGRNIAAFLGRYDRNDFGGYAAHVALDGDEATNEVLIKNGAILYQKGDSIPSLAPGEPP